jgi:23S rRNA (uracil1939-C5)-methyltransferase
MSRRKKHFILEKVNIHDAGAKGVGVGKAPDGKVVFVDKVVPGDVCDVFVYKNKGGYYHGSPRNFHQLSDRRTQPVCEHFGVCGGCKWQHMDYQSQLFFKQKEVYQNLRRIGKLDLPDETPILGSAQPYFYRNKMEFAFSDSRWITDQERDENDHIEDRNALGFHIPGRWDKVLDIQKCHLQPDPSNAIRNAVKKFASAHQMAFFNPKSQEGFLRTLMIRTTTTGEVMVVVQFFKEDEANRKKLLDFITETFTEVTSLQYIINSKPNDSIYDQEVICYQGKPYVEEQMEDLIFPIHPKSFYQTNPLQAYELYKTARVFAGLTGKEVVYDLYTGIGTIAQFVAKNAKKVVGIESVPEAIADAKRSAEKNGLQNLSFFAGDMKVLLNDDFMEAHGRPDVVITDPPRDGMHPDVVAQLLRMAPEKIVYVSCNAATQARDLALMKEQYKIVKVQPVDMFPQTFHVENVVLLEKIKA